MSSDGHATFLLGPHESSKLTNRGPPSVYSATPGDHRKPYLKSIMPHH